jgi:hypothetical protein
MKVRKNASGVLSLAMMVRPMVKRLAGLRLVRSEMSFIYFYLPSFNKLSILGSSDSSHSFFSDPSRETVP